MGDKTTQMVRPSAAMIVACLGLVVALGRSAFAVTTFVGGDGQIHACVGRKGRLVLLKPGATCKRGMSAISWNQERPNELWVGRRDGPNQTIMKDPSLLYPAAREYAHYPGGHNEAYPDGPKNLFRNVYGYIAGTRAGGDFSTFEDGHNEIAICDAVLRSSRELKWVGVEY